LIEREHLVGQAGIHHRAGHPPNDARELILRNHTCALRLENLRAPQPILSHAGQNDSDDRASVGLSD
jgi:hypothetical protein